MANALYDLGRESFLGGDSDWDANNVKVYLIDAADYTKNLATDEFVDPAIAVAAKVGTSPNLTAKTKTAGVADAADTAFTAVVGDVSEELVIWQDTAVLTTSRLWVNIDTATGLPVTPNGGDINVQWDAGANKIYKL